MTDTERATLTALAKEWRASAERQRRVGQEGCALPGMRRAIGNGISVIISTCADQLEAALAAHPQGETTHDPLARIDCPLCGVTVIQVSSATLSLALSQHVRWACAKASPATAPREGATR